MLPGALLLIFGSAITLKDVLFTRKLAFTAAAAIPLGCLALLLVKTLHWPLISDAVLIHYVVLLIHHGLAPYRQVVDVNMPGCYLADIAVTRLFGVGALGWRLFDYTLMAAASLAFGSILWARSRFAAVLAASLFVIMHIADGVAQAGQRDFVVAVLLLSGFALLVRDGDLRLRLFTFGLCCGAAASIKPPAAAFLLHSLTLISDWAAAPGLSAMVALGFVLPLLACCAWLIHLCILGAFLSLSRGLVVYHAGMARHTASFLLAHAIPSLLLPVAVAAAILLLRARGWRSLDQRLALIGLACGLLSYMVQGKAYPYHRYPLLTFLWVLIAMQLSQAARSKARVDQALGWIIIAWSVLWLAPASTAKALRYDWRDQPSLVQLQADLTQLQQPGSSLDHQIQCMDTMAGCITVLDRMQLIQSTGFLYDCYFFAPGASPVKAALQRRFLAQIERIPPRVFVITDQWCLNLPSGYAKLAQWPGFADYLDTNYTLTKQRSWSVWDPRHLATYPFGYRIYVHR